MKIHLTVDKLYRFPTNFLLALTNILLIALSVFSACSTPPATLTPDWETRWLKKVPCAPPCWEGITPGKTTAMEALQKLQTNPLIASAELMPKYGAVTWKWQNGEDGGALSFHDTSSQVIDRINPYLPSVRLNDVIRSYGEPSHIQAYAAPGVDIGSGIYYDLNLIYDSKGIVLTLPNTLSVKEKPLIKEDMPMNVYFFAPSPSGLPSVAQDTLHLANREFILPWQGLRDFDFYCRDGMDGKICSGAWKGN